MADSLSNTTNMKKLLLAALATTAFALPSQAGVLLPNLYAREFCSMREMGASISDATKVAARASYVSGEAVKVTINGQEFDADVLQAARAAEELCPNLV